MRRGADTPGLALDATQFVASLFSYCGSLRFGFNADRDVMPDLDVFAAAVARGPAEPFPSSTSPSARTFSRVATGSASSWGTRRCVSRAP